MTRLLTVGGLHAGYGALPVVRNLSLHVDEGEVVALLGPNGAGKSTTLLTISGLLPALQGGIEVLGFDVCRSRHPERVARVGLSHVPEGRAIFNGLSVRENLRLGCARRSGVAAALAAALDHFPELEPLMERRAGLLSGGEQQMLALGRALTARPRVLMVDEMSLGLAPVLVQRLLPRLRTIATASGCGVLLVEQHVQQALQVADRAYVLSHGELVTEGDAAALAKDSGILRSTYMGESSLPVPAPSTRTRMTT